MCLQKTLEVILEVYKHSKIYAPCRFSVFFLFFFFLFLAVINLNCNLFCLFACLVNLDLVIFFSFLNFFCLFFVLLSLLLCDVLIWSGWSCVLHANYHISTLSPKCHWNKAKELEFWSRTCPIYSGLCTRCVSIYQTIPSDIFPWMVRWCVCNVAAATNYIRNTQYLHTSLENLMFLYFAAPAAVVVICFFFISLQSLTLALNMWD